MSDIEALRRRAKREREARKQAELLLEKKSFELFNLNQELQKSHNELRASMAQAKAANRAKSDFLANMSHEIRTPLSSILGFAENIIEDTQEAETSQAAEVILRQGGHLLELINDILDISKIEADKIELESIPISIPDLLFELERFFMPRAQKKGLELAIELAQAIPTITYNDPIRLKQVLVNLLENAIKFTESGSVTVIMQYADDELRFSIRDTGIGMNEEQIAGIFQAFTQADTSTTRQYGGTGLGLAISRRLAELMDVCLTVTSQPNLGSTFTLALRCPRDRVEQWFDNPSAIQARSSAHPAMAKPAKTMSTFNGRTLVVDDVEDNRRLLSFLLKKAGIPFDIAEDGKQAVAAVECAKSEGRPFAMILLDMQMPVMDGYAAAQELRMLGYTMPIIAVTASAMIGDREKCLAAGCTEFLSKPINRKKLFEMLDELQLAAAAHSRS